MAYNALTFLQNNKQEQQKGGSSFLSEAALQYSDITKQKEIELQQEQAKNNGGFFGGIGYAFEKIGLGLLSAVEGIWDYTAGGLAKLFGADDWAEQQFANDWVNYNHADEWYNPSDGWKLVGDVAGGIGSSLPSMAALAVVGWATGGAAVPAMITTFLTSGLSAAGNATKEAYRETGELGGKEFGYGALSGITEGAVETFSDMVLGGVGGQIRKAFNKDVVSTVATKTLGKEIAKSFFSEGFEEVIGTITEPYWKRLTYDKDAENASFQEIGYAALVGGLSGAIMTGVGGGFTNARSVAKGNNVVKTGTTSTVLQQAQSIQTYETQNHTENEVFEAVSSTYNELQQSLAKTNGEVQTVKQKMLLGRLQSLNTQAIFQPTITTSAENIFNNAEEIANRMNQYGYKDASGNPITITAEQIRQGIDTTNAKTFKKSMISALKNNSVLRTLSVMDATGQIMLDTVKYKEAALTGQTLSSQVDLNRFIETATDSELQAVGEKLGIDNWQGLTSTEFQEKITDFVRNGGVEAYKNERLIVKDADNIGADTAQKLPSKVDMQENGIKRYYLGDSQVAIIKDGDNYRIYDYSSKRLSKVLTESEVNKVLKQLNTQEKSVADSVKQQLENESELKRQAAEIDEYARENISEYKTLNAPSQSMIRQIIRNGRAAGVSEDFVLTTARVSARSGLNIVFSKEASFVTANGTYADGAIDLKNNQIIINPDAKNRTGEMILIHELTHAIYNLDGGVLQVAEGLETMTDAEIGKGSAIEVSDEINAHFAEQTLSNKNILERLVAKKPTVKEKILNFFKKSSTDYSEDAKLTGAAKKLFKQYQKLFNDFSARNQGNNATEINTNKGLDSYALAKDEKNGYNNQKGAENGKENSKQETREERNGLGNVQGRQRTNQVGTLRDFSRDSKKAKLESPTDRLEYLKILKEGGHTQVKIDNQGVNNFISFIEIKEDALLPVLKDIRAENEKIGFKTKYTVSGFNVNGDNLNYDNAIGLYSTNSDTIYIKLSAEDITNTNNHERLHNVESKYPDIYNAFREEVKQIFGGDYSKAVDFVAKDWGLAEFSLKESEFLAEFFAGGERIDFGSEIDAKRDFIVEKYRKILAKKGNLDNLRYALPDTDSNGTKLSQKQREYFADSKVVDKNGNLKVVYHGSKADITEFDSRFTSKWNAYGDGFYFTSDKSRGERYAKGKLLETYLDIKTPFYADNTEQLNLLYDKLNLKQKDVLKFTKKEGIDGSGLFELNYYASEHNINIAKAIQELGFDGIISKGTDIYGRDTDIEYVVYKSNQVKNTTNLNPTKLQDIRYAISEVDSNGKVLSEQQRKYFKDSKVVDKDGNLLVVYHGTNSQFYTFRNKTTVNGRSQGDGFYFATNSEMATEYGGRVITAYLNIKNPFFLHKKRTIQSELEFRGYDIKELASKYGIELNEFDGINWGKDEKTLLTKMGYDGVISVRGDTDTITTEVDNRTIIVAYKPNQIKEITNKTPTKDTDMRYALAEDENNRRVGGLTKAQRAKFVANNTKLKVYSRADAEVIINDILANRLNLDERYVANLSGKSKNEIIDYLFKQLNGANEGYRGTVALKIADYIIENATMEDMYSSMYDFVEDTDVELVAYMNKRRHSFDLSGIQGEINYKFDRKNTIALQWGTKKGGMGADQIAQEIEGMGLHTFTAINEADQFFEMLEAYDAANKRLNTKVDKKKLADYGDQAQIDSLRQEIAKDILKSYDTKGTQSKYGKLVEKYTEKIANLRQQVKDVQERNNVLNSLLDKAQKMKELKLGTFLNATDFKSDTFKQSIESLAKIKFRGNFNNAGTHRVLSDLRQWYSRENPLLENIYNEDVEFMLDTLSKADRNYTTQELKMLRDTMSYFINLVENYNRVYKQGKWVEAIPEAQRYIDVIHSNEQLKVGIFNKLAGSGYMQTFGDPLTVARRMDRYDSNGFYTEMMTELRNATVDSEIAEMEIKSDYNEFLSTNKKYLAEIKKNKVKFNGVEIPKTHLISLYMTMKRSHSHAGLVLNGFSFVDTDGKKVRVNGFAPSVTTDAEILTAIADTKIEIENLLTDTDMQFVAILEKGYNVDAKKLKADRDMQRLGFTNATEDYYYPIRRGNIAKNIDTSDIASELDRVSNSSFNKDTVKGAKQELFIESAATVFNRHIKAVTKYAYLSPAIETFNRLYSLDISGNKNKPVSVSTESANTWSKANKYFSKLISDIQGIPSSSSEGMKVLSFIRSSYAKFQLGANPKVWVTQLSSIFASSSMLDTDCIIRGMTVSAKDVDTYCSLAKLRNSDNTVAMAQGLLEKVDKFSNALMTPIGKMDRFVVKRLFGACQVQVEKNGGAKVGTTANKVEAGKLLRNVILETQQNSMATERSAAMRSGNEIMRTITMFSADSMKVAGRVIDSVGELSTLKAKLKNTADSAARSKILSQIKVAKTKVRKSVTALITSAAFMASVAKLFRWLYKKDEDENTAEVMTVDFIGNLFGGLPVIKEIYGRFAEGYDVDNYAYSAVNDLLDSVQDIYDIIESLSSGNATEQDINKAIKKLSFSAGQILGIPTRNMYNILLGLTKRISPTTAYQFESKIYKKNFVSDLNEAIENDDTAMVNLIMSMILEERVGDDYSEVLTSAMKKLYTSGYSVLPKSIGSSITYNGETITLTNAQQKKIKSVYSKANAYAEKMVLGNTYKGLTEEQQAKALKQLYDAYYSKALQDTLGIESDNKLLKMSKYIPIDRIAAINAGISDITSDKMSTGKVVTGSKRSKVIKYLLKQNLTDEQRLLILAFQGYTVNNLEYKGWTTEKVKNRLLRYILSIKTATQAEKTELCEMCGFEVKNGVVVKQSLYSKK